MCFWQQISNDDTYCCQDSKKNHDSETTIEAGTDDLARSHASDRPEGFDEPNAHNSDLSREKLIEVDSIESKGTADHQHHQEHEKQCEDSIGCAATGGGVLIPYKNEDNRAGTNNGKGDDSLPSSRKFINGEERNQPSKNLSRFDDESIDEDVEVELVKHQCW